MLTLMKFRRSGGAVSNQRAFREYSGSPLVVDEQGIRRLYDELQSIVGSPSESLIRFHVEYSDKSRVENWSIEDLLADENRSFRRIKTIEVQAASGQHEISLKVGTKKKIKDEEQFVAAVLLDVSAPDRQRVFVVQSLIEDRIKSFRANRPAGWMILLLALAFLLICVFTVNFMLAPYLPPYFTVADRVTGGVMLKPAILTAIVVIGILISLSMLWLFPDLEFLLGRGIERHQRLERIKTNLFWVAIVGTIVSVIAGYVVSRLS
jgi:hypothetical protein